MPETRIRGICTAKKSDPWFYCDLLLIHQLLPRVSDERWLLVENIADPDFSKFLTLHGHPNAQRVSLNLESEPLSWFEIVDEARLKMDFLADIRTLFQRADPDDQVVLIINGHGSAEQDYRGQIEFGFCDDTICLRPQDLLPLIPPNIRTTLILNSCFSGAWVGFAIAHPNTAGNKTTIITRCDGLKEVLSFPSDSEGVHRGGYFPNFLVAEFYQEYNYHFPRPGVLTSLENGIPTYKYPLPAARMPQEQDISVHASTASTAKTVLGLVDDAGTKPCCSTTLDVIAREAIEATAGLPLRLIDESPGQTPTEITGSRPQAFRYSLHKLDPQYSLFWMGKTKFLISIYNNLPNGPDNLASSSSLSQLIQRYRLGFLNFSETDLLRKRLLARLSAYHIARTCAKELGAEWADELTPEVQERGSLFAATSTMISRFYVKEREYGGPPCWVNAGRALGAALSTANISGDQFDQFIITNNILQG